MVFEYSEVVPPILAEITGFERNQTGFIKLNKINRGSSKGKTAGFGPVNWGSNPCPRATKNGFAISWQAVFMFKNHLCGFRNNFLNNLAKSILSEPRGDEVALRGNERE